MSLRALSMKKGTLLESPEDHHWPHSFESRAGPASLCQNIDENPGVYPRVGGVGCGFREQRHGIR